ncbi:MAG: ATP-binding protein [Solirubrobacterales bacterium]
MTRLPVRIRLTFAFAAVMTALLAATGLFVHQRVESNLDSALDQSLSSRVADIAALAQQSDSGLTEARLNGAIGTRGQVAQIVEAPGTVLDQTPGLPGHPLVGATSLARASREGQPVSGSARIAGDQSFRLLAAPIRGQGRRLVVIVGQSTTQRNNALSNLTAQLLVGGTAALVLASLAGYALTGAAFRPVDAMRRRAATISASDLGSRLPSASGNDELGRLGRTLNEMLARIEGSVTRERTFISDASHELRSPLSALRTELELIARDRPTGQALQLATDSAIEETDRLRRLTDDLLLLTRADDDRSVLRTTKVQATDLLLAAAERGRRAAPDGLTITASAPSVASVSVDRDRVGQALDNLLSNAIRYAAKRIELAAQVRAKSVELHVLDDGPGFPTDYLPHAWERFTRADPARTSEGTGLGLSIVRTVAELHGGRASARNRPEGGADVSVTLPRPKSSHIAANRGDGARDGAQHGSVRVA